MRSNLNKKRSAVVTAEESATSSPTPELDRNAETTSAEPTIPLDDVVNVAVQDEPALDVPAEPAPGFRALHLSEPTMRAVIDAGFEAPTPIQEQSIPVLLDGRDLIGQAQTG